MFRKKPVVIEAIRFLKVATEAETHFDGPIPAWLSEAMDVGIVRPSHIAGGPGLKGRIFIQTLEGEMGADAGDWIIQGVKGEIYPIKHEIFVTTYEPVSDTSP